MVNFSLQIGIMKIRKVQYLSLLILCVVCALGVVGYEFFTINKDVVMDPHIASKKEQLLAGIWIRQDNPKFKLVFGSGTRVRMYVSEILELDGIFAVTATCDGETYNDAKGAPGSYLQIKIPANNVTACQLINSIDGDKLSLTPAGGKATYIYKKVIMKVFVPHPSVSK